MLQRESVRKLSSQHSVTEQTVSVVQFNTSGSNQPKTLSYSFYIHLKADAETHWGICSFLLSVSRAEIRESVIMGKPFFCILLFPKSDVSWLGSRTGNDGKVTDLNRLLWSSVSLNLCRGEEENGGGDQLRDLLANMKLSAAFISVWFCVCSFVSSHTALLRAQRHCGIKSM